MTVNNTISFTCNYRIDIVNYEMTTKLASHHQTLPVTGIRNKIWYCVRLG